MNDPIIHPLADVAAGARVGGGTRIWQHAQVREGAQLGEECILGKGVYVGEGVHIGNRVKVQNNASVYEGTTLEDGVFIGPHVCLTNDKVPRAVTPEGQLKRGDDWDPGRILIRTGAAVGAAAVVVTGVTIGRWAMVGAGAVVTRDVPDYGLVLGNPARLVGYVCRCGNRLVDEAADRLECPACGRAYERGRDGVREAEAATRPSPKA